MQAMQLSLCAGLMYGRAACAGIQHLPTVCTGICDTNAHVICNDQSCILETRRGDMHVKKYAYGCAMENKLQQKQYAYH